MNSILHEAKQYIEVPDIIIDLYDLTLVWISPRLKKLSGYKDEDLINKQSTDFLVGTLDQRRQVLYDRIVREKGKGEFVAKAKSGEIMNIETKFKVFEFDGVQYVASHVVKVNSKIF